MPATEAVASSCADPSGVPDVMPAGLAQVTVGVAWLTVSIVVLLAELKFALPAKL